jgi:hypothetical protein
MDRQTVVATVLALEEWLTMDHEARWQGYRRQVENLRAHLTGLPNVTLTPMSFTMDERLILEPVNCLVVDFAPDSGTSADEVSRKLARGNPSIRCVVEGAALVVVMETVRDGDELIIAERVRQAVAE